MANTPKSPLAMTRLWRAAEGHRDSLKTLGLTENQAKLAFSESVASGEVAALQPALKAVTLKVYQETEDVVSKFTTQKKVAGINVREKTKVFEMNDQSNIPGVNAGDTFIPGGLPTLLPRQKYPQIGFTGGEKEIWAGKIGEAFGIDWETIVNTRGGDVDLIREAYEAFGRHARNQEQINVASLLVTNGGVNVGGGYKGLEGAFNIPGNPSLSDPIELQKAFQAVMQLLVEGVNPHYSKYVLVTAPNNVPVVKQALKTTDITRVPARTGDTSEEIGIQYKQTLDFGINVEVVGLKWLSAIFPGIGGAWFLIPVPSSDDLPVLTSNFLKGYESPSIWVKDSNAKAIGGGTVDALQHGDFDSDAVETKVRHVHGANALWTGGIAFSLGTGV